MAANYLNCDSLLQLCCAKHASKIKQMEVEEIRKYFNITNDFSPEEEAKIMEENKIAEQSF